MTHEEIAQGRYELRMQATENEQRRRTMLEVEGERHRQNLDAEHDRHREAVRRIEDEARAAAIRQKRNEISIAEARLKDVALITNTAEQ